MNLTNKHGYPDAILEAIKNDSYDKGDSEFSITGLMSPPRIRILAELHKDELEVDVDDEIFKLYGHVGHALLERAGKKFKSLLEKRFFATIANTRISAQIDSLSLDVDGTLRDWKFTTVYGFKAGTEPKREWVGQLNTQKYLLELHGYAVNKLEIWGLLRDWRPSEAKRSKDYPNKVAKHDIPMYSTESVLKFLEDRITIHRAAEKALPLCDSDDNWGYRRCIHYCNVAKFCKQYQSYQTNKKETKL